MPRILLELNKTKRKDTRVLLRYHVTKTYELPARFEADAVGKRGHAINTPYRAACCVKGHHHRSSTFRPQYHHDMSPPP